MVDWQALEGVGGVATAVAVVVAAAFGIAQWRQVERNRLDLATMDLLQSIHGNAQFLSALRRVLALPANRALTPEEEDALWLVAETYENLGILVFERKVALAVADDYFGGGVRVAWARARPHLDAARAENPKVGEWFQWLAERLGERAPSATPAYVAHRDWRP